MVILGTDVQQPLGTSPSSSVPSTATAAARSSSSLNSSRDLDGLCVVRISSGPRTRSRGSLLLLPWRWPPLSLYGARCSAPSDLATYSMVRNRLCMLLAACCWFCLLFAATGCFAPVPSLLLAACCLLLMLDNVSHDLSVDHRKRDWFAMKKHGHIQHCLIYLLVTLSDKS